MPYLKLTSVPDGKDIYVNPDQIVYIQSATSSEQKVHSTIFFNSKVIHVEESPEKIILLPIINLE